MNNVTRLGSSLTGGRRNAHLPKQKNHTINHTVPLSTPKKRRTATGTSKKSSGTVPASLPSEENNELYERVKLSLTNWNPSATSSSRSGLSVASDSDSAAFGDSQTPQQICEDSSSTRVATPSSKPSGFRQEVNLVSLPAVGTTNADSDTPSSDTSTSWIETGTQTISSIGNIFSSIACYGDNEASTKFNSALGDFTMNEAMSKSPNAKRRPVDVGLFSVLIWAFTVLLLPARFFVTRATVLVQAVFLLGAGDQANVFDPELDRQSTIYLRKNKFKPWKFLKEMDLHQRINKEMMNAVRKVENVPKNGQGLFCHGSWVGEHEKMLQKHAVDAYGLTIEYTDTEVGAMYEFESDNLIRLLLDAFNLTRYARSDSPEETDPVMISISADGAVITNEISHFTIGVKITDPRAEDPMTGVAMCLTDDFQSQNNCFPIRMFLAHESKLLVHDYISDLMARFARGFKIAADGDKPELSNFEVLFEQDMSHSWKITRRGAGTATKTEFPCYCCEIKLAEMHVYKINNSRCSLCKKHHVARCFCQPISTQEYILKKEIELAKYAKSASDEGFVKLDAIKSKSKILYDPKIADRTTNKLHIDYRPSTDAEEIEFGQLINSELRLRLRQDRGKLAGIMKLDFIDRRKKLKKILKKEDQIDRCRQMIARNNKVKNIAAVVAAESCFPCILHAENRISEAIFYHMLAERVKDYADGGENSKKRKALVEAVTDIINTVVLGDPASGNVGHWRFPSDDAGKTITKKTLTNEQARKCVFGLKTVVNLMYSSQFDQDTATPKTTRENNEKKRKLWHDLLDYYRVVTILFRQHSTFSDRDLRNLHVNSQMFMRTWVELFNGRCVSNYIHMLGAGHFYYYAEKYDNLHRHSQQGWEAMNKRIKRYFHNNTNHGGRRGRNCGKKETRKHGYDLFRWVQRWTMWRLGLADAFFNPMETDYLDKKILEAASELVDTPMGNDDSDDSVSHGAINAEDEVSLGAFIAADDNNSVNSDESQYIEF